MAKALIRHHLEGYETTLRQLHKISDMSQPEALTVIAQLENSGIIAIDHNIGDAFESVVIVDADAQSRLDAVITQGQTKGGKVAA
ncbi:MAG: hypothetical protein ABJN35_05640 [Erythrobacter sp.]